MTIQQVDTFAKGDVVRHTGCYSALARGAEYTVIGLTCGDRILIGHRDDGEEGWLGDQFELVHRFEPVPAAGEGCRPCEEGSHSFCSTTDVCDTCKLSREEVIRRYHSDPIVAPQPKQAKTEPKGVYVGNYPHVGPGSEPYISAQMEMRQEQQAARLRNIAALKREMDLTAEQRLRPFPHVGRNFALRYPR